MEFRIKTQVLKASTVVALLALVGVTLVTPTLVEANEPVSVAGSGAVVPSSQTLTVASDVTAQPIERDNYTITELPKPVVTAAMVLDKSDPAFTNDITWDIQWPFPVGVSMSSPFGHREKPCEQCSSEHQGVDFTPGYGSTPQAIYTGVVKSVSSEGDLGYHVVITHTIRGHKVDTVYGHLQQDSTTLKVGDKVKVGDPVGLVGSTGMSTGAHLHFGVYVDGKVVDPMVWMQENVGVYRP